MYTGVDADPDRQRGDSTEMTEIFWCNQTMTPHGPDDRVCDADSWPAGRGCFRGIFDQ